MPDIDNLGARAKRSLTKDDLVQIVVLMSRAVQVKDEAGFKALEPSLKRLFDYRFFMCGFASVGLQGTIENDYLNVSYPELFVTEYIGKKMYMTDPIVDSALEKPGLRYLADLKGAGRRPRSEDAAFANDCGIIDGYSSSIANKTAKLTGVFSFMAPRLPRHERTELIVELVAPHLHEALCRLHERDHHAPNPLSERELEILRWIRAGRSSWQISMILSISEATVKFHIKNIMRKLDASTRTQAVASAMQRGYIELGGLEAGNYPKG
jgi:DNA-binding CsgD family transcriptional regulator